MTLVSTLKYFESQNRRMAQFERSLSPLRELADQINRTWAPITRAIEPVQQSPMFEALRAIGNSPALKMARALKESPVMKAAEVLSRNSSLSRLSAFLRPPPFLALTSLLNVVARAAESLALRNRHPGHARCEEVEDLMWQRDVAAVKQFVVDDLRLPSDHWAAAGEVLHAGRWRDRSEPLGFIRLATLRLQARRAYRDRSIFEKRSNPLSRSTLDHSSADPELDGIVMLDLEAVVRQVGLTSDSATLLFLRGAGVPRSKIARFTGWPQAKVEAVWKRTMRHLPAIQALLRLLERSRI